MYFFMYVYKRIYTFISVYTTYISVHRRLSLCISGPEIVTGPLTVLRAAIRTAAGRGGFRSDSARPGGGGGRGDSN